MKKLEIFLTDETITLTNEYGMIDSNEAHEFNEATDDMFVTIRFGASAAMIRKSDVRFIIESEVHDA